jgi:hypothetical protein
LEITDRIINGFLIALGAAIFGWLIYSGVLSASVVLKIISGTI